MDQMPGHSQADEPENWDLRWRFILENYPVMTPFAGDEDTLCVRMELKDLRQLPKQFWYLGNNSFLLHGFFQLPLFHLGHDRRIQREEMVYWRTRRFPESRARHGGIIWLSGIPQRETLTHQHRRIRLLVPLPE